MKIYLTLSSIPRFQSLSKNERRKWYRYYCVRVCLNHWLTWVTMGMFSFAVVILEWFIRDGFPQMYGYPINVWIGIMFRLVLLAAGSILFTAVVYGIIARYIIDHITPEPKVQELAREIERLRIEAGVGMDELLEGLRTERKKYNQENYEK